MKTALKLICLAVLVPAASLPSFVWSTAKQSSENSRKALTPAEFRDHMKQLADAWNGGDARVAADLFAEDALYSSPPNLGSTTADRNCLNGSGASMGVRNQCKCCGTISFSTKNSNSEQRNTPLPMGCEHTEWC
jgi:hypothetical protein